MEAPKGLTTEERKLWKRYFIGFRPRNEVEVDMAKRYLKWSLYFVQEEGHVAENGTTVTGGNGIEYPSPHFSNMKTAEAEMRRLWQQISKAMVDPQDDTDELGQFGGL
jgi:hypothetical protein